MPVICCFIDFESGRPGSNSEWGLIYYKASITAQSLLEPSSLRGSTLGTRPAEHKGCKWACKLTDGCSLHSCVRPHLPAYATEINSTQLHAKYIKNTLLTPSGFTNNSLIDSILQIYFYHSSKIPRMTAQDRGVYRI